MFFKPMLAHNVNKATEKQIRAATVAQPKLDGFARVMVYVKAGKTAGVFSRIGRSMHDDSRLTWVADLAWPMDEAVLDCEAIEGDGLSWGQGSMNDAQGRRGGEVSLVVLDICQLGDVPATQMMAKPFTARREALEQLFTSVTMPSRVGMIEQTMDQDALWQSFVVERKGEGIMLKDPNAPYASGKRSWSMLKRKKEFTVDVVITGITTKPTYTDSFRSCEAALTYGYWCPAKKALVTVGQGVRFGTVDDLQQYVGKVAELWSNGIMRNGGLRFAHLIRWRDDKAVQDCTLGNVA